MSLIETAAIIGAITGSVSLGIVIYKTIKEKPNLSFEVKRANHFPPYDEHSNFHGVLVNLIINNKGGKSTSIHSVKLQFEYKGISFNADATEYTHHIAPHSSKNIFLNFNIDKKKFDGDSDIHNAILELIHTHRSEQIKLQKISKT